MARNPIASFIKDAIDEKSLELNTVTKPALYEAYSYFCDKKRLAKESIINFGKILKQKHGFIDGFEGSAKERVRVWQSVSLNEEYIIVVNQGRQTTFDEG